MCAALNTLTLETFDAAEELILDAVPGLLEAIFDLMDKLNPAVAQVLCCVGLGWFGLGWVGLGWVGMCYVLCVDFYSCICCRCDRVVSATGGWGDGVLAKMFVAVFFFRVLCRGEKYIDSVREFMHEGLLLLLRMHLHPTHESHREKKHKTISTPTKPTPPTLGKPRRSPIDRTRHFLNSCSSVVVLRINYRYLPPLPPVISGQKSVLKCVSAEACKCF